MHLYDKTMCAKFYNENCENTEIIGIYHHPALSRTLNYHLSKIVLTFGEFTYVRLKLTFFIYVKYTITERGECTQSA